MIYWPWHRSECEELNRVVVSVPARAKTDDRPNWRADLDNLSILARRFGQIVRFGARQNGQMRRRIQIRGF